MKTAIFLFISFCVLSTNLNAATPGEVPIGGYLRESALRGFDGETAKFSDFRGKPLIINVWASWCAPCRAEMGALDNLARRYNGKQFNLIGISTDDDGRAATDYNKEANLSFRNFLDSHVMLENMLGANTIPMTILVDAKGRILEKVRGARQWDSPEYVQGIAEAFGVKLQDSDSSSK